jgi:alpha-2-macroglobulin
MLGDRERADTAFASAIEALATEVESTRRGAYRSDYGSVLRDSAAILALATDAKAKPEVIRTAMSAVEVERARTSYASTQDMAWMVLAARAIAADAKAIRLDVGGTAHDGSFNRIYREQALAQDVRIANTGAEPVRATIAISGAPFVPEPASATASPSSANTSRPTARRRTSRG